MKKTNLFAMAAICLLTACSPRVITHVVKTYPDVVPTDSVYVIELGEKVPNTAETIGRVAVVDQGMSTNCRYDQVLRLAREATGKNGGNGLAITDHLTPSFWGSSCHQVSGLMLRMSSREVDTLKTNPVQDFIDFGQEIAKKQAEDRRLPSNTLEASIGYGWINSKLYDVNGNELSSLSGLEWKFSYRYIWSSGWGIGMQYSGFKSNNMGGDLTLSYIAPECAWGSKWGNWIFKGGVGVGLFLFKNMLYNTSGVGCHATLGMEYILSKHVGLGVTLNSISASLPKQQGMQLKENERSGIARINLLGGLRYYF